MRIIESQGYKKAQFTGRDYERARKQLQEYLQREPTDQEILIEMQRKLFRFRSPWKNPVPQKTVNAWKDKLPGGKADGKEPSDFEHSQVERGKEVEYEHTDNPDTAREIAMDHLEEHKDYYAGLKHMEEFLTEIEQRRKQK